VVKDYARHQRSYGSGTFVFDPLHYLALIEMTPNALDQAAALQGWELPDIFQHLRHLMEARMGNRGNPEFIQVLRMMEASRRRSWLMPSPRLLWKGSMGASRGNIARLDHRRRRHLPDARRRVVGAADPLQAEAALLDAGEQASRSALSARSTAAT
jgi:hypothetical protein